MNIGDTVSAVDDVLSGVVTKIVGNVVHVESEEGFPLQFDISELVVIEKNTPLNSVKIDRNIVQKQANEGKNANNRGSKRRKERYVPPMEVDLHIQKLTKNPQRLTNYEMLELQLDTAKRQLDFALNRRIQRIVFIHGVGEGVLKEELQALFRRYDQLSYQQADLRKYGQGATEVYIPQKAMR